MASGGISTMPQQRRDMEDRSNIDCREHRQSRARSTYTLIYGTPDKVRRTAQARGVKGTGPGYVILHDLACLQEV